MPSKKGGMTPNYFFHLLERLKSRGIVPTGFIDAGAHFGETNDIMQAIYPGIRVISFEANPHCESTLKQKGIEYIIGLLGKEMVEKVPFYLNPDDITSTGCSIYLEKSKFFAHPTVIDLPMYRLDEVVPIEAKLNFLKMDVQGAELDILDGATKLLPIIDWIYLEVSFAECNEGAPLFGEVFDYLRARGYRIDDLCDPTWVHNRLLQGNFLFGRTQP
jgi:FkbM family methyltransferase